MRLPPDIPVEVEAVLLSQPGATLTEAELVEQCRVELTAYQVPQVIEMRDSLTRCRRRLPRRGRPGGRAHRRESVVLT